MAERLSQEITQLLAELNGDGRSQGGMDALVRARLTADIAEGLAGNPRAGAAGAGDRMRLAALLDHGLPPAETDAMLAALAQDPVGRAELSSAAELVDAANGASQTLPPRLLARAVETFGGVSPHGRPAVAPWPSARPGWTSSHRMLGLAAVLLVAVVTPVVLLVIGDRSDLNNGPTDRGLSDSGTGKKAVPAQKPATPATSCDDKAAVQPGEAGKPERSEATSAPADDPCRPKPPAPDSRAIEPRPAARN
jgi:hypothetical protein